MNIRLRVANLVKKHDTHNPYHLAKALGITVMFLDLPFSVRGFFLRVLRRKYIVINASLSEISRKVVLCHELGHACLHPTYGYYYTFSNTYFVNSRMEAEANMFAAHLLYYSSDIDAKLISSIIQERNPNSIIVHQILSEILKEVF